MNTAFKPLTEASRGMFELSPTPLEPINLKENLKSKQAGAFSAFEGWVRDRNEGKAVLGLEYEASEPLCRMEVQKIFQEARKKFNIIEIHCFHRVGKLKVGEIAVWVGVIAMHRDAAFKACRYVIDEIKRRLPIWKKEYYEDGASGWVHCEAGAPPGSQAVNENEYYSRQISLPQIGVTGQKKLKESKVLVIGAGGLGCSALLSLAGVGVGTIGICEHDLLEESNLHRQPLYSHKDIGQPKIELARTRIASLNPSLKIVMYPEELNVSNVEQIIKEFDCILDCTDNFVAKFLLNDAAVLIKKPIIQSSIYQFEGQIRVYVPGQSACLRCLWTEIPQPDCVGTCSEAGVIGVVPGVFGQMQAMEAIKWILDLPGTFKVETIIFNLLTYELRKIKQPANPSCPLCSAKAHIRCIDEINYSLSKPATEQSSSLTIDISQIPKEKLGEFTFVDIREPLERMLSPVKELDCVHLPLSNYESSNFEFKKTQQYIIFCAKGVRSLHLTQQLHEEGICNTLSLNDGTDAIKNYFRKVH